MKQALFGFLTFAAILGCGGGPEMGSVRGKIVCKGQPVARASVFFSPTSGKDAEGITNENGEFTLGTFSKTDGAPVGTYRVRVAFEDVYKVSCASPMNHQVEVKSGNNDFLFELDKLVSGKK